MYYERTAAIPRTNSQGYQGRSQWSPGKYSTNYKPTPSEWGWMHRVSDHFEVHKTPSWPSQRYQRSQWSHRTSSKRAASCWWIVFPIDSLEFIQSDSEWFQSIFAAISVWMTAVAVSRLAKSRSGWTSAIHTTPAGIAENSGTWWRHSDVVMLHSLKIQCFLDLQNYVKMQNVLSFSRLWKCGFCLTAKAQGVRTP